MEMENDLNARSELQLDFSTEEILKTTVKWTYLLSLIGLIGIGFLIIITIVLTVGTKDPSPGPNPELAIVGLLAIISGFVAVFYFLQTYFLFKFSTKAKKAFRDNNSESLAISLKYLRSHHIFTGIVMIFLLIVYILFVAYMANAVL